MAFFSTVVSCLVLYMGWRVLSAFGRFHATIEQAADGHLQQREHDEKKAYLRQLLRDARPVDDVKASE